MSLAASSIALASLHISKHLSSFSLFLDDCIADRAAMIWNKELNEFFVLGRHLLISVFITTQHVKGLGPMLRGNADVVCLQPIFQHEARITLADLYGGFMDRNAFVELMDQIVYDENLPDSTPQDPKKEVRTMFINDYENTTNPQMKFKWYMAEDPGPFKLCAPEYWKAQQNALDLNGGSKLFVNDPVDELDQIQRLQDFRFE